MFIYFHPKKKIFTVLKSPPPITGRGFKLIPIATSRIEQYRETFIRLEYKEKP